MQRALLLALLSVLLLLPSPAGASPSGVVISQVYGGGGNSDATFANDFVELFNAGAGAIDLSSWTVQYATATGTTWQTTPLTGTIPPGRHYLVQLASGGSAGSPLPTADATGTSNLAAGSGKIALVRSPTALTCGASPGSCPESTLVEDFVGYGSASDFEGTGSAPAASNTLAAARAGAGCTDTGDNAADFTAATPDPRNSTSPARSCGTAPGPPGTVQVDLDIASVLSISLDRASLSFGTTASGATPTPLGENVTVSSNNAAGYGLSVTRTTFSPKDLPLAIGARAPAGATLAPALVGDALVPIPVPPAAALTIGTKDAPSVGTGDVWATRIGFSSPLPLVPTGRYAATVTFSAIAR